MSGYTRRDPNSALFFPASRGAHQAKYLSSMPEVREKLDADIRSMMRLAVMYGWLAHKRGMSLEIAKEQFLASA